MWIAEAAPALLEGEPAALADPHTVLRSDRISVTGAANDTLSFRIGIRPNVSELIDPVLRGSPVVGTAGEVAATIELYRMHRVHLDRFPGWHVRSILPSRREAAPWDVLVPLDAPRGGMPARLRPGETLFIWADVEIARDASAGAHRSTIELRSAGLIVSTVTVEINVLPFVLPDAPAFPVLAEVDYVRLMRRDSSRAAAEADAWRSSLGRADFGSRVSHTMQVLYKHGLTPVVTNFVPSVQIDAYGRAAIDWKDYDALLAAVEQAREKFGLPQGPWPLPVESVLRADGQSRPEASAAYAGLLRDYFRQTARHFAEIGRLERSYAMMPGLDLGAPTSVESVQELASLARSADERIRVAIRFWPQDMRPYGWIDYPSETLGAIGGSGGWVPDIWVTPAQFFDAERMAGEQAAGRETWLMVDRPPFSGSLSPYGPPTYTRVLPWQAEHLRANVLYLGCINCWPESRTFPSPEACVRTDPSVLLYPGERFGLSDPVASVRLKELREGIRDSRYREALRSQGLGYVGDVVARALVAYAGTSAYRAHFQDGKPIGWINNPSLFDLARTVMADALIHAREGEGGQEEEQEFTSTANWRRFTLATSNADFSVEGIRMRLDGLPPAHTAEVQVSTRVVNRTRVPVSGSLELTRMPATWTASEGLARFGPVLPGGSARVRLSAQVEPHFSAPDGLLSLPVELQLDDGTTVRRTARLAFATALPVKNEGRMLQPPVRVDGDLRDWPPGRVNVASGFRLISADSAMAEVEAAGGPHHATTVLIMRDEAALYFAVNCAFDGRSDRVISRHNRVVYDDLVPVGEELVEILIDPLNAGTRSPSDLYHVAIKPSGAYLSERGMAFGPPCGSSQAWSAKIETATAIHADRWTAELRVPLSSFVGAAVRRTVWGLNVTRYDASTQEFSTWSGATGNAYDPLSLGNLYLP